MYRLNIHTFAIELTSSNHFGDFFEVQGLFFSVKDEENLIAKGARMNVAPSVETHAIFGELAFFNNTQDVGNGVFR